MIVGDASLELADVHVHVAHVLSVVEDEGLVEVETAGDDVLGVLDPESLVLLNRELLLVEELLVVSQLNHHRHVESFLQPPREDEWHQMAQMHHVVRRATSRVEVKGFALLVLRKNDIEVPVREEDASLEELVGFPFGSCFHPSD